MLLSSMQMHRVWRLVPVTNLHMWRFVTGTLWRGCDIIRG